MILNKINSILDKIVFTILAEKWQKRLCNNVTFDVQTCHPESWMSICVKSTEIQSRVGWIHLFDFERESGHVGSHFKFSFLNSLTELSFAVRSEHNRDTADLGFLDKSEPECQRVTFGHVGAQQCDIFTRVDLHSLRNGDWDPAWNKQQRSKWVLIMTR